jgi:hypothetical protein
MAGEIFGFKAETWEKAKLEATCAIVRAGRRGDLIFSSDLAKQISTITIQPHSHEMDLLLDQISKEEDAAGRGILTALVVLRDEGIPGSGFWASATDLGRKIKDKVTFWAEEVKRVIEECKKHPFCP